MRPTLKAEQPTRSAFSLIELAAVMVVLAILAAIAIPKVLDLTSDAKASADEGALGAINSALKSEHIDHRVTDAPASEWVTTLPKVAASLQFDELPRGIRVEDGFIYDQRGNQYELIPETESRAARITLVREGDENAPVSSPPDEDSPGTGSSPDPDGAPADDPSPEDEDEGGVAALPPQALLIALLPWIARGRREQ